MGKEVIIVLITVLILEGRQYSYVYPMCSSFKFVHIHVSYNVHILVHVIRTLTKINSLATNTIVKIPYKKKIQLLQVVTSS